MNSAEGLPLSPESTVLALIPHYGCEQWLGRAVNSLLDQSRPPDAIAVIDDGSAEPPDDIVGNLPGVTLLSAANNVGPYALVQAAIDETGYDAILFQDADDWSAPDRLIRQLRAAERTGAEIIGSYHVKVDSEGKELMRVKYPTDANGALAANSPANGLLHATTLVSAGLLRRLGGFSTGLRFGADTEFMHRAHWVAKVINLPRYLYFRMERPGSLTNSPSMGFSSRARAELVNVLHGRAVINILRVRRGKTPDLRPLAVAPPVRLVHRCGPRLKQSNTPPDGDL